MSVCYIRIIGKGVVLRFSWLLLSVFKQLQLNDYTKLIRRSVSDGDVSPQVPTSLGSLYNCSSSAFTREALFVEVSLCQQSPRRHEQSDCDRLSLFCKQ